MIRINNIEFRKYNSTKTKKPLYEIIKWKSNPYYGKKLEYFHEEWDDFHQVYTLGQTKLNKNAKTVISKSI